MKKLKVLVVDDSNKKNPIKIREQKESDIDSWCYLCSKPADIIFKGINNGCMDEGFCNECFLKIVMKWLKV